MRAFRLIRREAAEHYLLLALLSFAASVSLTRLFLALTGYPQIGGGELHIAHVLWGGLLLFAAALLPLMLAGQWVHTAGALLAGVGVGLFIDEVGKFITQRNDYFYPAAAPIIYTFFLLTLMLVIHLRRITHASSHPELHAALDAIRDALDHPLDARQRARLRSRLDEAARTSESGRHADLAISLRGFIEAEDPFPAEARGRPGWWPEWRAPQRVTRLLSGKWLRAALVAGIFGIGLLTLKNPTHELLLRWLPPDIDALLENLYVGRRVSASLAPFWYGLRLTLEVIVGVMLLASACLLASRHRQRGCELGYVSLLLSLTTINLLLFYFEQFSTIITTAIQFLLLLGILLYRQQLILPSGAEPSSPPASRPGPAT